MGSPPPISIDGYDPYESGWYLLPGAAPPALVWSAGLGLTPSQVSTINSHTLQGLIELVYVRVGNDVLYEGLNGLDDALETTTQTLQILSAVQELHNALKTSSLGSFSAWFNYDSYYSNQGRYQSNYNSVASAFFGVPIIPDFIYSSAAAVLSSGETYVDFAEKLADVREQLSVQVNQLSDLAVGTPDISDPNSLYNTTRQVLSDLPPLAAVGVGENAPIAWSDAKLWAMDFYGAFEGQDLAQAKPTQIVIKYTGLETTPGPWGDLSISPGRQIGMGTGFRSQSDGSVVAVGGNLASIRIVTPQGLMKAQSLGGDTTRGTFFLTFSGRLAIGVNSDDGNIPTMVMVNPINDDGEVQGAIQGNQRPTLTGGLGALTMTDVGADVYIGTFGGITRGQAQNAGSFEQNITLAMTAAQGLNNTQTEQVRGYLFTFEEYYKSASSVLTSLTQLIQKFAQGIRPA